MQVQAADTQGWISYAVTALVIAVVFAVRWRRMSKVRPLKVERLWIFPALYAVVAVGMFVQFPPHGLAWLFCGIALALGAALGWQRGKLMTITVDPDTHALNQTASPAAVLFILVLVAMRVGARAVFEGDTLHLNAMAGHRHAGRARARPVRRAARRDVSARPTIAGNGTRQVIACVVSSRRRTCSRQTM